MAQTKVNHLSTMWETQVQSLGWEDLLEKEMATHSSTLAWTISWTEEPGRLQSMSDTTERLHFPSFKGSQLPPLSEQGRHYTCTESLPVGQKLKNVARP